jgi:hypothetical protein
MLKQKKQKQQIIINKNKNSNTNTNLVPYSNIDATTLIGLNLNNKVRKETLFPRHIVTQLV